MKAHSAIVFSSLGVLRVLRGERKIQRSAGPQRELEF
jgi:hypothetical protein